VPQKANRASGGKKRPLREKNVDFRANRTGGSELVERSTNSGSVGIWKWDVKDFWWENLGGGFLSPANGRRYVVAQVKTCLCHLHRSHNCMSILWIDMAPKSKIGLTQASACHPPDLDPDYRPISESRRQHHSAKGAARV